MTSPASSRVLREFSNFREVNIFLRGMFPLVGFQSTSVYYERHERFAGQSKYPLKKMLAFAFDGITSFSVKPIRFICILGLFIFAASVLALLALLCVKLFGFTVTGWTSLIATICLFGGLQMLCLGIIGEYIGKTYQEVKARPRFLIEQYINRQAADKEE